MVVALGLAAARASFAQGESRPSPALQALLAEFDRQAAKALWPGFDPRRTPLAIYDGRVTWLVRHPSPPGVDARHLAGVMIHEAFHVFQRARHVT